MSRPSACGGARRRLIGKMPGFSLIEVMVAVSLLAFALALVFAALRGATRATERAELVAQRSDRWRAVQGFLRTQLGNAMPVALATDEDTGEAIFFRGDASKLEFVASMPGYLSRGGLYAQTLELVPGEGGQQLIFQHRLLTPDGPLAPEREPEVLLEGIAEGGFAFRRLDEEGAPSDWESEWPRPTQLPWLVRLDLRFADANLHWPDWVVALRLRGATGGGLELLEPRRRSRSASRRTR